MPGEKGGAALIVALKKAAESPPSTSAPKSEREDVSAALDALHKKPSVRSLRALLDLAGVNHGLEDEE